MKSFHTREEAAAYVETERKKFESNEDAIAFMEARPFPQVIKLHYHFSLGTNVVNNVDQARAVLKSRHESEIYIEPYVLIEKKSSEV